MLSKAPSVGWMCSLQRRWAAWADVLVGSHPGATGVDFLLPIQRVDRDMFHATRGVGYIILRNGLVPLHSSFSF
jgi:hypothetical protein